MHAKQKFKNYANPTNLANFSTFLVPLFLFRPSLHHHIVAVVALTILALVAQTGEHNTQLHARGCILVHGGVRLGDDVQNRIGAQVRSELILARQTEAGLHHGRQIQAVLVLAVGLLQHQRLLIGEPVALAPLQLSTQLGEELLVLDGCHIVDDPSAQGDSSGENVPTGIEGIVDGKSVNSKSVNTTCDWFTLQGVRLPAPPATKGIYIKDGKKIVLK